MESLLTPDPAFWCGKRVFLTGHTGFKGTWLALWLTRLGAVVRGYALPPDQTHRLYRDTGLGERIDSLFGDIRDAAALDAAMSAFAPDIVLHLAAQALVQASYRAAGRDLRGQRHRHDPRAGGRSPLPLGARGRRGDHRQVLRKPRMGVALPGDRGTRRT